ncbi:MAG: ribonucleoside triphosphate reductase [Nitrosarchaeum sp.]|nr:ribonucleoside triphosphate reductase [Nitrosarchaeum sp.]
MITTIKKRDGKVVSYDKAKIINAIDKAMKAVDNKLDEFTNRKTSVILANQVENLLYEKYDGKTLPTVEEIQDFTEEILIKNNYAHVAKAFIIYRNQHEKIRDAKKMLLDISKTMEGYLHQSDWRVNENSNVNYSLGGLILHNSGAITANYWLDHIYSKEIADAHKNGDIHLHDLCMFSGYCAGWSLRDLLIDGLGGVSGKITSRPAKHLSTAVNQMVNFLGILQNEWAGAMAFSSFDTYLAPYIKVDNMDYESVKQNIQSFIFGVNTPSRWGSQSPFTNVTFDWTVPTDLKDQPAIVGGQPLEFTYGDCQKEMDMINRAFLDVFDGGDADGRGFSYPIPTYNVTKDFDWDSDNAKMLFKITGKYGTPYFQNFINSNLDPSDVRSMCCRLRLDKREIMAHASLKSKGGGLFGAAELTGSVGVVTINLPRIGFLSKSKEEYLSRLDHQMEIARNSLEIKRKIVSNLLEQGLFPYTKRYLKHGFDNHFSTIGLIGMHESTLNFMGKSLTEGEALEFAKEVLHHMRMRLVQFQQDTGYLYNLEATPGEGTSYRLAKIDKEKYPLIKVSGIKNPYYTNSTQLPVDSTNDIFDALDLQDPLQVLYTGGTVFHSFIGEAIDAETCKKLVKTIAYNYHLPYFTITPTFSICQNHGYLSGEQYRCPKCESETEVYSRVVGYYRPTKNWNVGKKSEFADRLEYSTLIKQDINKFTQNATPVAV